MKKAAQKIRRLACDLYPGKPLGKKGVLEKAFAAVGDYPNSSKCSELGFYLCQNASRRNGRLKSGIQSVWETQSGWKTKLHMNTT